MNAAAAPPSIAALRVALSDAAKPSRAASGSDAPGTPSKLAHVPALDGLRGLAVLCVLLFHANGALPGGFLGVDLFFVLSGYLITSLLLVESLAGGISLRQFWLRRLRRLMPAFLSLMPFVAAYAWWLAKPAELAHIRGEALAALAYVANWRTIVVERSYWDLFLDPSPLEHCWSLAIEEQFYVIWPLIVWALLDKLRVSPRTLGRLSLALATLSATLFIALADLDAPSRVYLGTDTRAAAICLGAALAIWVRPTTALALPRAAAQSAGSTEKLFGSAGLVAFTLMLLANLWFDGESSELYRGGLLGFELCCVVVIASIIRAPNAVLARALAYAPLRWLGLASYGLYLWHWPLNCVLTPERTGQSWAVVHMLRFTSLALVASASYFLLEQPIRKRGLPGRPAWLTVSTAIGLCATLIGFSTRAQGDREDTLFELAPQQAATLAAAAPAAPGALAPIASGDYPGVFSVSFRQLPPSSQLEPGTQRVLVLGDSVANKLGTAMRFRQAEFDSFVAERGVGNCTIMASAGGDAKRAALSDTHACAADWRADVEELKPDVTFIVLGGAFFSQVEVNQRRVKACAPGWAQGYAARLTELVRGIAAHAGKVAIARIPYPVGRWRNPQALKRVDCLNEVLVNTATALSARVVDLMAEVCPTKECSLESAGSPIRPDGLHFDGAGAEATARFTLNELSLLRARK